MNFADSWRQKRICRPGFSGSVPKLGNLRKTRDFRAEELGPTEVRSRAMFGILRRSTIVLSLSVGAVTLGCPGLFNKGAKHAYLDRATSNYVYKKPLREVWPRARQLLLERGYELKDIDASHAETAWKLDATRKNRKRYSLVGIDVAPNRCKVQFNKTSERFGRFEWRDGVVERDLNAELDLIQDVEPGVYRAMQDEGDRRARSADE